MFRVLGSMQRERESERRFKRIFFYCSYCYSFTLEWFLFVVIVKKYKLYCILRQRACLFDGNTYTYQHGFVFLVFVFVGSCFCQWDIECARFKFGLPLLHYFIGVGNFVNYLMSAICSYVPYAV